LIDFVRAREIAEAYIVDEWGNADVHPFVIVRVIPHRYGWEFGIQRRRFLESGGDIRKAIIGVGGVMVDRREGAVTAIGSGMTQADDLAYHRKYDQETGESPWMNRTCGC
jgi:hypothetical protein